MDKATLKWFSLQSCQDIPIDVTMIQENFLLFAKNFNQANVKFSDSWIEKLQKGMEKYRTTANKMFFFLS